MKNRIKTIAKSGDKTWNKKDGNTTIPVALETWFVQFEDNNNPGQNPLAFVESNQIN